MTPSPAFLRAFHALPDGTFFGRSGNRRYAVSRTAFANGRSHKLIAHELGGRDYISLNLYQLSGGETLLRPCEMTAEKVTRFVLNFDHCK